MIIVITTRGAHSLSFSVCVVVRLSWHTYTLIHSRTSSLLTVTDAVTASIIVIIVVVIIAAAPQKSRY